MTSMAKQDAPFTVPTISKKRLCTRLVAGQVEISCLLDAAGSDLLPTGSSALCQSQLTTECRAAILNCLTAALRIFPADEPRLLQRIAEALAGWQPTKAGRDARRRRTHEKEQSAKLAQQHFHQLWLPINEAQPLATSELPASTDAATLQTSAIYSLRVSHAPLQLPNCADGRRENSTVSFGRSAAAGNS